MSDRRNKQERRENSERRRPRERGRYANDRFAVVEIGASELHIVVLTRTSEAVPDQVKSASLPWRSEAPSLNSQAGLAEFTAALRRISDQFGLQGVRVQFVLGGEFCVTKAVQGSNDEVRIGLQQLEQRSRLYLMLGTGEKVTVSSSRQLDARHQYAVAAVCNKKTLDTIHRAAISAGMQIESIEPSLVSTSRVIGRLQHAPTEPCLLIHIDKNSVELGVCHEGRLLLDYRPGGHTDPEKLVEVVRTHLNRLKRHVARQLREPPPELKRVYLCGDDRSVAALIPVFLACEQFDAARISPEEIRATWSFESGIESAAMVPALGSLLSTYLPAGERETPDFMEHIVASTRTPLRPILIRSVLPLVAVLLVAVSIFTLNFRQQSAVDDLQQQVDGLATAQARALELRLKLTSLEANLTQLQALAAQMQSLPAADAVARIGHCMPSDVWLNKLTIDDLRSVQIIGASYLEAGVFDFVRYLELAPGFSDIALRGTRAGQSPAGPVINFDVELNLGDQSEFVKEVARNE